MLVRLWGLFCAQSQDLELQVVNSSATLNTLLSVAGVTILSRVLPVCQSLWQDSVEDFGYGWLDTCEC